jgi:hypothetical protein
VRTLDDASDEVDWLVPPCLEGSDGGRVSTVRSRPGFVPVVWTPWDVCGVPGASTAGGGFDCFLLPPKRRRMMAEAATKVAATKTEERRGKESQRTRVRTGDTNECANWAKATRVAAVKPVFLSTQHTRLLAPFEREPVKYARTRTNNDPAALHSPS